jgi:6-phosphogluconate dehydrogenase
MDVGIVGLGRMGTSLAGRASERGHRVVGWDPDGGARDGAAQVSGVGVVAQLEELVEQLQPPRFVLLYVPHGDPVDANLEVFGPLLDAGDVVADAGNSHGEDSRRRHEHAEQGFRFLDIGTSGDIAPAVGPARRSAGTAWRSWSAGPATRSTSSHRSCATWRSTTRPCTTSVTSRASATS